MASSALIAKGILLLPDEAERIYCQRKKKINVNYFKCPALYYSKSDKRDESNAVCAGERMQLNTQRDELFKANG